MTPQQANELLRGIGSEMSNVLYNLGQHKSREINVRECALFAGLAKKWDAALSEHARAPAPTSEPGARERIDDFINRMLHAKPGTVCPMCGQNGAHDHTTAEVLIYRNGLKHGLWRQEQDRVVGQGAAQAAEDDAGATGDSGRAGTDEHNEHRAGQSIGKHGSFGQDSGSAGLSGAVPVQASAVVATPASPAVPDPKPQYKFDDAQGTVTLTNADKMPAYTAVSADPAPLVAQASPDSPTKDELWEQIRDTISCAENTMLDLPRNSAWRGGSRISQHGLRRTSTCWKSLASG